MTLATVITATFSWLHRALDLLLYTEKDAYRSISVGVSERYLFIPPIDIRVLHSFFLFKSVYNLFSYKRLAPYQVHWPTG